MLTYPPRGCQGSLPSCRTERGEQRVNRYPGRLQRGTFDQLNRCHVVTGSAVAALRVAGPLSHLEWNERTLVAAGAFGPYIFKFSVEGTTRKAAPSHDPHHVSGPGGGSVELRVTN